MQLNASSSVLLPQMHSDAAFAPIVVDWDLGFTRPAAKKALSYWSNLCAGRTMPKRRDVHPGPMRSYLSHVNLIDVLPGEDGADFIISLQGQHAQEVFGPAAHRRLDEFLPIQAEQRWRYCFNLCRDAAKPVRLSSRIRTGNDLWLGSESLLAPLGDEANGVDALFLIFDSWPAQENPLRESPAPF